MKKPPDEVKLSRDEGDALIERLEADRLSADDRRVLVKLVQLYFWLTLALRETKISLKRLKMALFGKGGQARKSSGDEDDNDPAGGSKTDDEHAASGTDATSSSAADQPGDAAVDPPAAQADPASDSDAGKRQGHGRAGRVVLTCG